MFLSDGNLSTIRTFFVEEAGERLAEDELAALQEDLDGTLDEDGQLNQAECREAIRRHLRWTRQCEHGRPRPGHPEYEEERCPACDALEYGDRRCDERRGT